MLDDALFPDPEELRAPVAVAPDIEAWPTIVLPDAVDALCPTIVEPPADEGGGAGSGAVGGLESGMGDLRCGADHCAPDDIVESRLRLVPQSGEQVDCKTPRQIGGCACVPLKRR